MTILAIGRAFDGVDVDVSSARWSGAQLSLTGDLFLGAITAANRKGTAAAVRDRLMALIDSRDEPAVAVTWSEDASVDGFYRPTGATVDYSAASLNDGYASWSVDLERVGAGSLPQVEIVSQYGCITNDASITNATLTAATPNEGAICGIPLAAYEYYGGSTGRQTVAKPTRSSDTGDVLVIYAGATLPTSFVHTYAVDPADAYDGACSVVGTYAGVASQLCLGRSMSPSTGSDLTISNGLIRAKFSSGALQVQVYDTGVWETVGPGTWPITIAAQVGGSYTWTWSTATRASILRNSPEQVTVRLIGSGTTSGTQESGRVWLDVTVQRGARHIAFNVLQDAGGRVTVGPSSSIGCTTITGGLRQTSNDAKGNRYVLVGSAGYWGTNTTTGAINQTAGPGGILRYYYSAPFAIGSELGGSGATGINVAQAVAYEWFAGRSETARVVLR